MNPFPGLRPFTQEEDYLFFGREEQTLELLQRLGGNRFVAVVGTSGSGKSSLVRCGLLSQLLGGKMLGAGAAWEVAVTHPGGNPLALLTDALLEADLYDRETEHARENLLATLSRSHFGLVEAVKQAGLGDGTNFLLVVDQFEEIFRFHEAGQTQQEAANEFVSLLLEAAAQKEVPIYVVLTMRSDFIGECGQFEGLAEMVNRGEFLIPRLTREQYKRVIEGPIKVAGGQIAPRLLQRLLNDLGQQADQLPCLQHALMRTWDVWAGKGDTEALDLDDYQRVGKMSQALSLHADEIYESLAGDRQRELCQGMFQALTVEEANSRGIRRPQRLGRLCQILEVPADELLPIIDAYRQSGVTFLMPPFEVELTDQTIIDISHESLMRVWTRLRQWVELETQAAGIYHRLSESATLHGQGKAGLYRDPELGIALAWREAKRPNAAWAERYRPGFATAMGFLEASQQASIAEGQAREAARQHELEQAQQLAEARKIRLEQQKRSARKLRKLIAGVAVVAVIAVIACAAALVARNEAGKLAQIADAEAEKARKNEQRAEQSQQQTAKALTQVAAQKAEVESSLTKAEKAEQVARAAEEAGRKLLYTTDMRLAPFVWRDDRTTAGQLRVLLAKHIPDRKAAALKPDLRGFEWHYYQHLLESSAAVFAGHGVSVTGGAFTSNGQLVTLDQNGQVRRWDLGSQDEDKASRHDLPGGSSAQVRVLSPTGRVAALAQANKVHVFDTSTGKEKFQIDSANNQVRRLIFSRDSDRLVIVDDKIRWVSAVSGAVIASVAQKFNRIESLAFSADGLTVAVVGHGAMGSDFSIFRLDATAKKVTPLATHVGPGGTLEASALTPDGRRLAVGAKLSGSLFVYDTTTGRTIAAHGSAHASRVSAMAFSGDGAKLATADAQGTIKIWADAQKLNSKSTAFLTLKGHQGAITTVGFSSDGKRLVTTSADKTARVWDLENAGAAIRPLLERFAGSASLVARFSPDGQLIAVGDSFRRSVRLCDAATGILVRELSADDNKGSVSSVAFSPTDNRLLAVGYGGQADVSYVALWDIDAGTQLGRLSGATPGSTVDQNTGVVGALAFSPDGKYLVAGFGSKNLFMGGSFPMPLKVWEVGTRRLIRRLNGHTNFCVSLDFSRDGKLLASGSRDGTAILWSTQTWKKARTLQNPDPATIHSQSGRSEVEGVAFSPRGKTLALASFGGNVQLWDVAAGKLLATLKGHSSAAQAVVFSPDGRTLASGSIDQTVRLWNVETRRELMQLDPGSIELGQVQTLAFSPDGKQLLAVGRTNAAFWSAAPIVWNDAGRAAEKLRLLLQSKADFPSRIRMLSDNLRLHAALARLDSKDVRVAAALAAAEANWHASRQAWPEAALAFDRLRAADPTAPEAWLRTPGLLRLATALLHQDRPRDAAALLTGGAKRRALDGLPAAVDKVTLGMPFSTADGSARVGELLPGSPASRSGLLPGDVIVKVNDTELTRESFQKLAQLLAGEAGTKVRLTVRHSGSAKREVIELTRERFINDAATGELLHPLRAAINERLARDPRHPGLLELRAELAGQWSGTRAQLADYTAAIKILTERPAEALSARLRRLYRRRGDAYVGLKQWQTATEDYARVVTNATADEVLLSNQALAQANSYLERESAATWTVLKPTEMKSKGGATLTKLHDGSILASGVNPDKDTYTFVTQTDLPRIASFRLEAMAHRSLPGGGPGRVSWGNFALSEISLKAQALAGAGKAGTVKLINPRADFEQDNYPVAAALDGRSGTAWSIDPRVGENHMALFEIEPSQQTGFKGGTKLTFTLDFQFNNKHALGRFRLSLSPHPRRLDRELKRLAAMKLTDPWQKLAAVYQLQGNQQAIDQLVKRRPKLAAQIGDAFIQDQDKDWPRAVAIYSRGITAKTTDALLLSKRARAYEALKKWDAAAADWSRAATANPEGAKLLAEFAQRLAAAGQVPLANGQFAKAQALYERSLAADPENDPVPTELAQLLLNKHDNGNSARWTVLKPTEMKSKGGATLTKLDDASILAGGVNPRSDQYTVRFKIPKRIDIRSIRLEALTHDSLPGHGPGRGTKSGPPPGLFALSRWDVTAKGPDGADSPRSLSFHAACADYSWNDAPLGLAGNWNITFGSGKNRTSVWSLSAPITLAAGAELVSQMRFNDLPDWSDQNLGRFRLSVSSDPAVFDREQKRFAVLKVTEPWSQLAAAYALNGRNDEAARYFGKALQRADDYEARKPIVELAARFDDLFSSLVKQQPGDRQLQLALARKLAERGKQRLAEKQPAKALADLQKSTATFTRLRAEPKWTVLTPIEMKTENGSKLELQKDGSVFVHQPTKNDTYTLVFQTELKGIKGLRLEALADSRLPGGGPGWVPAGTYAGNFVLSELSLQAASAKSPDQPRPIALRNASADFSEQGWDVRGAVVGNIRGGWAVHPEYNKDHVAVFETAEEVGDGKATRLTVRLDHKYSLEKHLLGRFRLSFTNDAATLQATRIRWDLKDSEVVDLNAALAKAYHLRGDQAALDSLLRAHPAAGAGIGDLYAADKNWQRAVAEYTKAITREAKDAKLLAKRAEAYEKLKQWDLAVADWTRASRLQHDVAFERFKPAGTKSWQMSLQNGGAASMEVVDGTLVFTTTVATGTAWHVQPYQAPLQLENGVEYVIRFKMKSPDSCSVALSAGIQEPDWHLIGLYETFVPPSEFKDYEFTFVPHDVVPGNNVIKFDLGISRGKVLVKEIVLLKNGNAATLQATRSRLIARAKAHAQQDHINKAVASVTEALDLTADRAGRARIIAEAAALPGVLEKLAERAASNAQFQAELARLFAERGKTTLANAARAKARVLFEGKLAKEPDNTALAAELADLLLIDTTRWTVLRPAAMKSEGGATLTLKPDGSVLASGTNPDRDVYSLVAKTNLKQINAIRLEALPDPSLPQGGPGRHPNGNFNLGELRVFSGAQRVTPTNIMVVYAETQEFRNVIAGRAHATRGWSNYPQAGQTNTAIIVTRVERAPDDDLRIEMYFSQAPQWTQTGLGRFRLSVSGDPGTLAQEEKRLAALKVTDPWLKLAGAYALNGRKDEPLKYFARALQRADGYEARKPILELARQFDDVLSALVKRQPGDSQVQLALARRLAKRGKRRLAEKQPAKALADLRKSRANFTRLLAKQRWQVLTPVEMKTENGSKLELQKDGSVFVRQPAKNDTYSLVFQTQLKGIKGLRLEALADSRLPRGGPGWATGDGNFVVSELSLQAAPAKSPAKRRSIVLGNASADFSQGGWDVRGAVDGNSSTGWAISPEFNKDHSAVFDMAKEIGDGQATRLTVRLNHQYPGEKFLLGRFRLSVSNDAATLQATRIRLDIKDSELIDLYAALGKAHAQQGQRDEAVAAFVRALALAKDRAGKARIITEAAPLPGVLEKLAERAVKGNAGRLTFAEVAYDHKKFAFATRLWAEALASDPNLGDDRQQQYRYHAARAAALAAAGQGKDEPPQGDAAKAKLRRQALDWLKAELSVYTKVLEAGAPQDRWIQDRVTIALALSRWKQDSDLAGIRDKAALAKLSAEEQKAFTQLWAAFTKSWADVGDLAELLKFEPRDVTDPKQFAARLAVVAPGFTTAAVGGSLGLLKEHFGRPVVVRTHPIKEGVPCILTRTVQLAADVKSKLRLSVSHDPQGDWQLIVKANGEKLYDRIIGPATTKNGWADLEIDLSRFAGRKVNLELHNHPNNWSWEFGYWARVAIVPEPDAAIVAVKRNAGRLAFALFAYDQKKFTFATRLWAEALASDPKLGEDRQKQYRYHAARAAALAAAGQGKDEPPLDDAAKAKLRRQALGWLKAELTVWTKQLASDPPQARLLIALALSDWEKEADLAGIRDTEALARLPKVEQREWQARWAHVKALVKQFASLPAAEQVEEVREELKKRNPGFDGSLTHQIAGDVVTELSINGKNVTDLAPVRALVGLKALSCTGGPLSDLSPLKGMKLTGLSVWGTQVQNLEPLQGMPLTGLDLHSCPQVQNLELLKGLPLTTLDLAGCALVRDLAPLKGLKLTYLNLDSTQVRDLKPLTGMPLTGLALHNCPQVRDLETLRGMPLRGLSINGSGVTDLKPLQGMKLEEITLTPKTITEGLDILRDMKSLKTIGTGGNNQALPAAKFWAFRLPGVGRPNSWMAQDRQGKWLAIPTADKVAVFDARTGKLVRTLIGHTDRVYAIAFSPDGKFLAGGNWAPDKKVSTVKLWDLRTGAVTATLDSGVGSLHGVKFSGDGKRLFGSGPGGVQIWDLTSGRLVRTFKTAGGVRHGVYNIGLSPDGKRVVCNHTPTTARVWEIDGDNPPVTLGGHTNNPHCVAYSPDGKLLATGSDAELLLWDAGTLKLVKEIATPANWLAFAPDGKSLLTAQHHPSRPLKDDVVTRWDLATYKGKPLPPLTGRAGWPVYHLSPDGKTLYTQVVDGPDAEGRIRVYDAATGKEVEVLSLEALAKRFPALLRGKDKPADNAERLDFAQVASNQKKFAFATRLWAEALAIDPKLGDEPLTQHRYNAARAAALAAAGQGKGEPPLDDEAKAKLRRQALDWLKAELSAWRKLLDSGPPQTRPFIVQTLSHWQKDSDLGSNCDKAALAKLPVEEQKAFTQLWSDVAALLKKAQEKPK